MGIDGIENLTGQASTLDAQRLQTLLDTMDIPEQRKTDLEWLGRNLHINNKDHPNYPEANDLLDRLLSR